MKNKFSRLMAAALAVSLMLCGCREEVNTPFAGETTPETTSPAAPPTDTEPVTYETTAAPVTEAPALAMSDIEMTITPNIVTLGTDELLTLEYRYVGSAENAEYYFGCQYSLEKHENGEWRAFPFAGDASFIDLAYLISSEYPTNSTTVSVSPDFYAEPLTEGKYRVVKDVCGLTLYAEFEIAGAALPGTETTTTCATVPPDTEPEVTGTVTETSAPTVEPPVSELRELLLFSEYSNYAWGFTQHILAVEAGGALYSISVEDEDSMIKLSSDDWYSKLSDGCEGNRKNKLDKEYLDKIKEFAESMPGYENEQLIQYGDLGMCDYGTDILYGIYIGDDGTAKKLKIASFGDSGTYCLAGDEAREFVNAMAECGIFSMGGSVLGGDGDLHELYEVDSEDGTLTFTINEITDHGFTCSLAIPYPATYYVECDPSEYTDLCVGDNIDVEYSIMYKRYDNDFEYIVYPMLIGTSSFHMEPDVCYKPVIYLYPEQPTDVSVQLDYAGELTITYPEYGGGWQVTALPDGTLIDADGNTYPYLFWEGRSDVEYDFSEGFCVKGSETEAFLREKLSLLGLIPAEYEEFIDFWAPRMSGNEYNVISFQGSRYTDSAVLTVAPEPDTVLRVFMAFYPSDEPVEIPEQKLVTTERKGFTLVEWGGSAQ